MNRYMNAKLVDIDFIYDQTNEMDVLLFGKISNEVATDSLNVRSGPSEPGGTWIFQRHDGRHNRQFLNGPGGTDIQRCCYNS
ncbi:hypothetical protein TNCV_1476241 [Trichonephila clavipes]|nr:hypothetical protein TNCV_1476241 [Trichonephila clavipes]